MENAVKYTPGPWRVFNGTDIFPDDEDREADRHIADCDMAGNICGDEQRANARLMATSPEMLDALRLAEPVIAFSLSYYGAEDADEALQAVRDAISKATS
jgi:hypothetical protein